MRWSFLTRAALCLLLPTGPALAGCAGSSGTDVGRSICISADREGYSSEASNLSVTVKFGAVVTSTGGDAAIDISEEDTTLVNNGTLRSSDNAVRGGRGFALLNTGAIAASRNAIELSGESDVEIRNSGQILATYQAINMDARDGFGGVGNSLVNEGQIVSTRGEAVEAGDEARIHNAAGAVMQAYDDAVQVGERAKIVNHGVIRTTGMAGDPQDAIDIDSGRIVNGAGGRILSDMEAAIDFDQSVIASVIDNAGEISGVKGIIVETHASIANVAVQEVINRAGGLIVGRGGLALRLGAGEDRLVNHAGARIDGSVDMGPDADVIVLQGNYQGSFGGKGGVIDGGIGTDRLELPEYSIDQITDVSLMRDGVVLSLDNGAGPFRIALRNWESFEFGGTIYSAHQIAALAPQKASLTRTILLAMGGLTGLGLIAARRRMRQGVRAARRACQRAFLSYQSVRRTSA
ncbi:hypothetical protein [Roseovarius aestuarii]|uniref:Uncharacterized protein n=1 Tax=Roseovarius aestuarii TaxID=475083 RepID=A0A1X7BNG0_9RHOB|nr:hypothetical protein [Roseovarius aestuarii]SMC11121.1 hypothetical protein ROA7745_00930 [Roseovarius aestuarii]